MAIISRLITASSDLPLHFKAVKGKMYEITDVHLSVLTSGATTSLFLVDYLTEERTDPLLPREFFVGFNTNIAGQNFDISFGVPVKTKFISVLRDGSGAFVLLMVINYKLINASKKELIIEWFRKGI